MSFFLDFDPYSFLHTVKKLFVERVPYEYIRTQESFIEMYRDSVVGLDEPCMNHEQILACLDESVTKTLRVERENGTLSAKAEALQNAFMFFVTTVSKKLKIGISEDLCLRTVSQQIDFHKKLVRMPKEELKKLIPETKSAKKIKDRTYNMYTYLIRKNERGILGLVKRHQHSLT